MWAEFGLIASSDQYHTCKVMEELVDELLGAC